MAYWYEELGYGIYEGAEIDKYQLIALFKQGICYVIVRGE